VLAASSRDTLTVVDGDPGLGKSVLTLDLAARVSCGLGYGTEWRPADWLDGANRLHCGKPFGRAAR
jgi:hypothetical protein